MMKGHACYLESMGMINSLGMDKPTILAKLMEGTQTHLERSGSFIAAKDVFIAPVQTALPEIPVTMGRFQTKNNALLLAAYMQIAADVEACMETYGSHRIAIVLGSSTSGINEGEVALEKKIHTGSFPADYHYAMQEMGAPAEFLAVYSGIKGINYTISTACSSSAKVFAAGRNLINSGLYDAVVVGGVDSLCKLTLNGFHSLESVSKNICNPMSMHRDGITIGEGACLFLMTSRKSRVLLSGVGESSDAYHISSPDPDGSGAKAAIQAALHDAGLTAEDIAYVNMHGTATPKNDEMESRAIHEVFGDQVYCSSTKSLTGHTLGAAGATEVGFCWLMLNQDDPQTRLAPHIWDGQKDDQLPDLKLVQKNDSISAKKAKYFLSNSFAFGGNNCCVILGKA